MSGRRQRGSAGKRSAARPPARWGHSQIRRDIRPSKRLPCQGTAASRRKVRLHLQDGAAALLAVFTTKRGLEKTSVGALLPQPAARENSLGIDYRPPPTVGVPATPRCTGADRPSQLTPDLGTRQKSSAVQRFRPLSEVLRTYPAGPRMWQDLTQIRHQMAICVDAVGPIGC
jgi:hypothetical protein